ncbi:MAG: hypothetical protein LBC88_02735 [Spirochaetaceae bacterium]|jgi:hypothetical protein|nr:hypothetical protein [Spirochaetaceae bacterium]
MRIPHTLIKTALALAALAVLSTGRLTALETGRDEFFKSAGIFFSMSLATDYETKTDHIALSMGVQANFFIFTGGEAGFYINPLIGIRLRLAPPGETPHNAPKHMDMYLGAAGGPAFFLYDGDTLDALCGAGADLGITMRLDEGNEINMAMGLGLGGTLEGRLNFYRNLGIAAGLSFRCNPAPESTSPFLSVWPYLGVGF